MPITTPSNRRAHHALYGSVVASFGSMIALLSSYLMDPGSDYYGLTAVSGLIAACLTAIALGVIDMMATRARGFELPEAQFTLADATAVMLGAVPVVAPYWVAQALAS